MDPTVIPAAPVFKEDIISTLPYRETVSLALSDVDRRSTLMIDDRRVMMMQERSGQWMLNIYALS